MPTYISKDDQQLGPFEDHEIIDSLRSGTYSYEDWCWKEGWEEWQPLRVLFPEPAKTIVMPPVPVAKKSNRKIGIIVSVALVALVILYIASPYYTLWRLKRALSSGDRSSIEALIDFPSVRESLKDQIRVQMSKKIAEDKDTKDNPFAGLAIAFAPTIVNSVVDNFVTPSGIAALIANSRLAMKQPDGKGATDTPMQIDWSKMKSSSFYGPIQFVVDIDGTKIFMSFTGTGWRVKNVEIKPD